LLLMAISITSSTSNNKERAPASKNLPCQVRV
jgi:hypothetical protein